MTKQVQTFKIVDPAGQSLLFLVLAYLFDYKNYIQFYLPVIFAWQFLSSFIHIFFHTRAKFVTERVIYFVLAILFYLLFLYMQKQVLNPKYKLFMQNGPNSIPAYECFFVLFESILAFWYYLICFREINLALKKPKH